MGRMLGSFADDEELDRPDLNKCPDCGCFFEDDNCPLCGMRCPDYMRAGNRRAVKKKKKHGGPQYKVTFIDWYHRWWFIILMLFVFPLIGIILLLTSPHKKGIKITVIVIAAVYAILSSIGISSIVRGVINYFSDPVDTSLSRAEYVAACEEISVEEFYRFADSYEDKFVSMTLLIKERIVDEEGYRKGSEYTTYYICEALDGSTCTILLRDCLRESDAQNFVAGAMIRIYGEGAGERSIYDMNDILQIPHTAPCIYGAYVDLIG